MLEIPKKPADTSLPILDAFKERWSPFAFNDQPIEPEKIQTMFEAARWAPSSYNEQPWRYVYATKEDGEEREKLESLLVEGNSWAKNAYILLIDFAKITYTKNQNPNRISMYDTGAATAYLAAQLSSLGLIGHQMGGFFMEKANDVLGVPDDFEPCSMMAIGYPADVSLLSPELQQRQNAPRSRKEQGEFVFRSKWQG